MGLLQLGSDYFFKPCLAMLFNAVVQPPLIFLYNVAASLRDLCDPIAEGLGYFIREIAVLFRAIRLVDYKREIVCKEDEAPCAKVQCDCTTKATQCSTI